MNVSNFAAADNTPSAEPVAAVGNPLRPVLVAVFSLKLVVAAFLLASVSLSSPLAERAGYSASE